MDSSRPPLLIPLPCRQRVGSGLLIETREETVKDPGFQLRPADRDDADSLFGLFAEVQSLHAEAEPAFFRPPERDALFERHLEEVLGDPEQHFVLACRDGAAVGYVHYFLGFESKTLYQPDRCTAYIYTLAVAKGHRRRGCGVQLIEHVKQAARRADARVLGIDFWSFNDAACACFEKAGFKVNKAFMSLVL